MPTSQQNTKVEMLVEAIETFALAIAQDISDPPSPGAGNAINRSIARGNARQEMASALRDFLAPSLRVITEVEHRVGDISERKVRTVERTDAVSRTVMPKY